MYLCNFGHNISTRCSYEMQISFLSAVGGVYWYCFGWGKVLPYELASVPIFQPYTVLFEISKTFIVNIIIRWTYGFSGTRNKKKMLFSSLFFSLGGRVNYLIISHKLDGENC